jgi:peptide subunit release factor 1 (eRF1)
MLTLEDMHMLASRPERSENSVLTLYLDTDQSKQANLNRGFEVQLNDMVAGIKATICNPDELRSFARASQRMEDLAKGYDVAAHGLVAIFDAFDGFFWTKELHLPLPNRLQWSNAVVIQPLAAAIDEYERVGIVMLDRSHLRLLTMCLGEVHEQVRETFDERKVRHTKTVGMNNLGAASRAQHKADEHVRVNLRQMSKRIEAVVLQHSISRLILARSSEITAELNALLPKRLALLVIGTMHAAINANLEEIRNAAALIAERFERQRESTIVTELVTSAAKAGPVVVGLEQTLCAVNEARIWQLICADGFTASGYGCTDCGALFSAQQPSCASCGSPVHVVEDVVERVIAHATRTGAKVEVIRDQEAESSLMSAGGIGAFLRTRTPSVRVS